MIKTIVYESSNQYTDQYVIELGHRLQLPVYQWPACQHQIPKMEEIIYVGNVYGETIYNYKKVKKQYQVKCVLGVGIPPEDRNIVGQIRRYNDLEGVTFFYLEGEMDPQKLNGFLRFAVKKIKEGEPPDSYDAKLAEKVLAETASIKPERLQEIITWYQKQTI